MTPKYTGFTGIIKSKLSRRKNGTGRHFESSHVRILRRSLAVECRPYTSRTRKSLQQRREFVVFVFVVIVVSSLSVLARTRSFDQLASTRVRGRSCVLPTNNESIRGQISISPISTSASFRRLFMSRLVACILLFYFRPLAPNGGMVECQGRIPSIIALPAG